MAQETYHYGQGKVYLLERLSGGGRGPRVWIGDVSELTGSITEESFTHQESYSGKKASVRKLFLSKTMEWSATMHELSAANIARFTDGTVVTTAAGTVTGEGLGTVEVGDELKLENWGVSNVVITDSAAPTPATIDAEHYEVDAFGNVTFNSLPTSPAPTMPLLAAYSHEAANQVAFLNAPRKEYALIYEGINLAEGEKPVVLELYKVAPSMLQTLSMITNGNQLASAPITIEALLDSAMSATGSLGQYGRIITVGY